MNLLAPLLPPSDDAARATDQLFSLFVVVALVFFAGVLATVAWRLLRPSPRPNLSASRRIPWVFYAATGAAAIGLLGLALISDRRWRAMARSQADAEGPVLEVLAQQYVFYFRSPGPDGAFGRSDLARRSDANPFGLDKSDPAGHDDVVTLGEAETTAGLVTRLRIRAADVIHGFYLPSFRLQVNAVPGRVTTLALHPVDGGQFPVVCNQYCGLGHYRMAAVLRVRPSPTGPSSNP